MQHQLFAVQPSPEFRNQRKSLGVVVVLRRVVGDGAGVGALGDVHRHVCALQQQIGVLAVLGDEDDPHAGLDGQRQPGQLHLGLDGGLYAGQRPLGLVGRTDSRQHQAEFVAPEPGDGVDLADGAAQPFGEAGQEHVTVVVAQRVVDLLEAIEVEQDDGGAATGASIRGDGRCDPVAEQRPVRQAGQGVVESEVLVSRRLAAQSPRHPAGQPGEHHVEQAQPESEGPVETVKSGRQLGFDGSVGQADLEHSHHGVGRGIAQGRVDLDDAVARRSGVAGVGVQPGDERDR